MLACLPVGTPLYGLEADSQRCGVLPLEALTETGKPNLVDEALARIGPDHIAKIMLTSGSTGMPKGVITTHRMLIANLQATRQVHPYLADHPPEIVDWLPWNHCYAGNFNLGLALYNGGTYRIARGEPMPGRFDNVLKAFADYPPTIHLDVPQGYQALADALAADAAFNRRFFTQIDLLFYAGSSLPEPLWRQIETLSIGAIGKRVVICIGYGSTQTTPLHTIATHAVPGPHHIGTPVPGCEVLLIPDGGRFEIRVRGDNLRA